MDRKQLELKAAAVLELRRRKSKEKTIFGIVCPKKGLLYSITNLNGKWIKTNKEPDIFIAEKLERVIKSTKRFIALIGGRGSSKSIAAVDISLADAKDNGNRTYCLREFQSSIKNSVHSLVKSEIKRFGFDNFDVLDTSIKHNDLSMFEFAGIARNIDSVKSTHGFKRFAIEEAQFISQASLDVLTPSLRNEPRNGLPTKFREQNNLLDDIEENKDTVSMMFIANPRSSADPFSKRFIEPYKKIIDRDGYYEDDLHLIVKINYCDNPWFDDSDLEGERQFDLEHRDKAFNDWKWMGEYNDAVDDAIIKPEWFDAAIDAHKLDRLKKVFMPKGAIIASHDPSDEGSDSKGLSITHGSIIKYVGEKTDGDIADGCDWALGKAKEFHSDWFVWDGDGMGTGLKRQISQGLNGTKIQYHMFRGSLSGKGQDNADDIYDPQEGDQKAKKTYAETFKNNRAQYSISLADRYRNTYRCVIKGEYVDPDIMISLDSDGIENITGLRAETCRIPLKKNPTAGLIQVMSKQDMAAIGIDSPNMFDSVMMGQYRPPLEITMQPLNYPKMSVV